ncbi:PREDICTED: uncharacterized protein LOC108969886 [Bactrocera latifrons]|uniref:uncharacterized protein LOC108969886 n=1 Tax=Bactrocera latifrons TaxID=174628 RepID=UPI0008DDCA27|nr:PREDICTED: uncharacterized protein LOC108969886 [Bactrocera latifrons]
MLSGQLTKHLLSIIILLAIRKTLVIANVLPEVTGFNENTKDLLKLLENVREQRDYNTVAICKTRAQDCIFEQLLPELSLPVVVINKRQAYKYKSTFSKELVIVLCLEHANIDDEFEEINVFHDLKQTRIVAYAPQATNLQLIEEICTNAMAKDIYNVLIIQNDFAESHKYYTCNKFPLHAPRYKEKNMDAGVNSAIFEHQFRDMHGTKILTYPDQLEPRTMLYYKADGKLEMEGYIGRLMRIFAAKVNATLAIEHPFEIGKTTYFGELLKLALNGTVDVAAGLTFPQSSADQEVMSYPVQHLDYCYMVPLPETVPINELFVGIVRLPTLFYIFVFTIIFAALLTHLNPHMKINFINLFLNDKSIRGILGQSFVPVVRPNLKVKLIIFLLCYMSIITNTTYQAYLQSYLTQPPLQPMYRTYDDMEAAGLKVLISAKEKIILDMNSSIQEHPNLFEILEDHDAWLKHRSSMNTKYVYPVSNTRWEVFEFHQSLFHRPIFYFNSEFCFFKSSIISLPTRPDLPYLDLLDDVILRLDSSGIIKEFISLNFFVLAKLKLVVFEDLSKPLDSGSPLVLDDFFWICIQYFGCLTLALIAFAGEMLYYRWQYRKRVRQATKFEFCN